MEWYEPIVWVITIAVVLIIAHSVGKSDDFNPYG